MRWRPEVQAVKEFCSRQNKGDTRARSLLNTLQGSEEQTVSPEAVVGGGGEAGVKEER